jgi:murein DD-endopeptidase MepM/ murein hydrolase activator NlpD
MKTNIFIYFILVLLFLILGSFSFYFTKEKTLIFENKNFLLAQEDIDNTPKIEINDHLPKICENRVFEVNLSKNLIYFFENCQLKETIPIAYQAPDGKWYQTPTGYYRVGVKREKHISSILPVHMDYAVQMYEDFFIHDIPYYLNGQRVTGDFTGGCIRLETENAKKFFSLAKSGDLIVSYKDIEPEKIKNYFTSPVNLNQFYIRQRFNNPIKTMWLGTKDKRQEYIQHAGIDLAPNLDAKDLNAYNIFDGKVVKIVINGQADHGLGNTVIVELDKNLLCNYESDLCKKYKNLYALYGHLEKINENIKEGMLIKKGEIVGKVGATGYGCNYWRIGEDGCDKKTKLDTHLHFEIKTKPLLESPVSAQCLINGSYKICYGYVPDNPEIYGYLNPWQLLFQK